MNNEESLVPVEQKSVSFYGDDIVAVRARGGGSYVPVRPICDLPGADTPAALAYKMARRQVILRM